MEIISDTDHLFSIELITYLDIVKILRHLVEDETSISSLGILFTEVAPLYDRDADDFRERRRDDQDIERDGFTLKLTPQFGVVVIIAIKGHLREGDTSYFGVLL